MKECPPFTPPILPRSQEPIAVTRAVSLCPSNDAEVLFSSSPQPCPALPRPGSTSTLSLSPSSRTMPIQRLRLGPPELPCSSLSCCGAGLLAPTPEAASSPQDALMVPSVLCHAEPKCTLGDKPSQITVIEIQNCGRLHR